MPSQECQLCGEGGGGGGATRGGARERADAVLSSPEHCGQRAERGSGLERLQPGTRHEEPAHRRPRLRAGAVPHRGQMGKLRLPGASESQGLSRTRTQDPDLEKALGSSCST